MLSAQCPRQRGFTLVELMVVVGISGVLASATLPSFVAQLAKGRRADAMSALTAMQLAPESWRRDHREFSPRLADLGLSAQSPAGHYTLAIDSADADGYRLSATARAGSLQARDTTCLTLRVSLVGGALRYDALGATGQPADAATSRRCWLQ